MTCFRPIINLLHRTQVKVSIALALAQCRLRPTKLKLFHAMLDLPSGSSEHFVGLDITRPHSTERLRFSGTDHSSASVAAQKAFSEYLEAITLWQLGATEEESRSGWACADSVENAKIRAYRELIERDSFISHFLCPELKTWVLSPFEYNGEYRFVRTQSVDKRYIVVFCGFYLKNKAKWLLGGACEISEKNAIHKALLEVVMMRKDWHGTPPEEGLNLPKRTTFWLHWKNQSDPRVIKNIENIFSGGGNILSEFQVEPEKTIQKFERRFSAKRVVIGCEHPDIIPLTFGRRWEQSELKIKNILLQRDLPLREWLTHPML